MNNFRYPLVNLRLSQFALSRTLDAYSVEASCKRAGPCMPIL